MDNARDLRFGVIGVGYWAGLQIRAWSEVQGARLAAICNRTVSRAEEFARQFGIPNFYGDADEMFSKEKLDFVDIITYPSAHLGGVLAAARHSVPVICQKPIAFDLDSCLQMQRACKDAGVPFLIHENYRWQPPNRGVKAILDEGVIGQPVRAHIQLSYGSAETFVTEASLNRYPDFALTDMGPHLFDLATYFFGEPQSVYCRTYKSLDFLSSDDVVVAMLNFGGFTCVCEISSRVSHRVFIEGKKGSIELGAGESILVKTDRGEFVRECPSPHYPWVSQYDENYHGRDCIHSIVGCNRNLFGALRGDHLAETTGEAEIKVMQIIMAAAESSRTGRQEDIRI